MDLRERLKRVANGESMPVEADLALALRGEIPLSELLEIAEEPRRKYFGNKIQVQAWWFESFVYFSNHPEIQQSPFSNCDKEEIKSFFKKNDFTIENRMRCVSSCTNTFLEVLGY
jgi:hypothetical protein